MSDDDEMGYPAKWWARDRRSSESERVGERGRARGVVRTFLCLERRINSSQGRTSEEVLAFHASSIASLPAVFLSISDTLPQ